MYLQDGFSTIFRIFEDSGEGAEFEPYLRMREVQLPKADGGPPIDTTTMLNLQVVTKAAQALFDYGDMTAQCNYDIRSYVSLVTNVMNQNRWYVVALPDSSTFKFWGCMYEFTPAPLRRAEFPLAEVKVGLLNRVANTGTETGPTINSVGTGSLVWPPTPRPTGWR